MYTYVYIVVYYPGKCQVIRLEGNFFLLKGLFQVRIYDRSILQD